MTDTRAFIVKQDGPTLVAIPAAGSTIVKQRSESAVSVIPAASPMLAVLKPVERQIVAAGIPGPRGLTGEQGLAGGSVVRLTAGEAVGGHRVVFAAGLSVLYANQAIYSQSVRVVGMTLGAAGNGDSVDILRFGTTEEPTWSWLPGDVFLGSNGLMTQTAPENGTLLCVGVALSATVLDVRIGRPIEQL